MFGHRESYSWKNKFYLLMGIDVGSFHLTSKSNSSPNRHCVDTASEYQCSQPSWAHKSLSLGQNGSHCPLREQKQHITYHLWTSSFLFYWFYRDCLEDSLDSWLCVFATLYYTKQSKIIKINPRIIISKNSHLKCYFSFFFHSDFV